MSAVATPSAANRSRVRVRKFPFIPAKLPSSAILTVPAPPGNSMASALASGGTSTSILSATPGRGTTVTTVAADADSEKAKGEKEEKSEA